MDFSQKMRKIEAEFQSLKGQVKAGTLTREEAEAQLKDLMIQDEEGKWWIIGYETGKWYYHDGEKWVRGEPPMPAVPTPPLPIARPGPSNWVMVLSGAIGFAIGNTIGTRLWEALGGNETPAIVAVVLWGGIGGVALGLASRDVKKVLAFSLLGALGFGGGYALWLALGQPWGLLKGLWGAVAGLILGVPLKNVIKTIAVSLVGFFVFLLTAIMLADLYNAGAIILADGLRGAIIGAAFGFALSYLEKRDIWPKQIRVGE